MDAGFLMMAIVGIVLVVVVSFLVRSFMKFILIGAIIYLLFHFGFIWGVDDLNDKLQLNRFFNPDANKSIQSTYGTFADKREQFGVVKTEEVKKVIDSTIQSAIQEAGNQINSVDKEALLKELQTKLEAYNDGEVKEAIKQSHTELQKVMTSKQVDSLKKEQSQGK
ncbi:hypothetical protein ACFVS2_21480 [Brevibacillus sp. NPDC058079]|uniref:hypothetical protein n=1 Tax=Brevibacillus sp. NPDC058079 TaxID=3346330 RepID=UPI0036E4F67B